jgi:O-antigen/teichoic acid export membrane protein
LQLFSIIRFSAFFLVSIFLVKVSLAVDQIATYEYVLFLCSIATGWWIHGFVQGFMADSTGETAEKSGVVFRRYSRFLIVFGGGILLVFIAGSESLVAMKILNPLPAGFYYYLFFHFILQAAILMIYHFHQQGMRWSIYLSACYFFVTYIGSFLVLGIEGQLLSDAYRWLAVLSIPVVFAWVYFYSASRPPGEDPFLFRHIPHLSVLMLIQGIGFISMWSDGFWVQYFYGTEEVFALFRYGAREFPLFVILTTTFGTAMIQRSVDQKGLLRIRQGSVRFIRLFFPLIILLLLGSQWLFQWVYSEDFVPASFIFDAYLLLIVVRVLFPRPLLIGSRRFRALLWVSVGELLINVAVSLSLYSVWGILGLILGTLIAHLFELAASIYLVHRDLKIKLDSYIPVRLYLLFATGAVLIFVVKYGWFAPDWIDVMFGR